MASQIAVATLARISGPRSLRRQQRRRYWSIQAWKAGDDAGGWLADLAALLGLNTDHLYRLLHQAAAIWTQAKSQQLNQSGEASPEAAPVKSYLKNSNRVKCV